MPEQVTEFTIDRNTWYRGRGGEASRLLCDGGERCCLGFYGQACGLSDEDLLDRSDFTEVFADLEYHGFYGPISDGKPGIHTDVPSALHWLTAEMVDESDSMRFVNTHLQNQLIRINDPVIMPAQERECLIIEKFAAQGITVKFIN